MFEKKIVLDTCALIWLACGSDMLSSSAMDQIENASIVYVCAISAWEISLKQTQGALQLPLKTDEWFKKALEHHNLTIAPLDIDILIQSNELPLHHKDPADRFIIATAIRENASIVTSDGKFKLYDVRVII